MLKGTVAVLVATRFAGFDAGLAAGAGAFAGHLFPVWLKFKGGKGVATYIGVLLGLYWPAALIFGVIWLIVAALFRYSSLAALIASALTPLALLLLGQPEAAGLFFLLTIALWVMHRANIGRLLDGTEGKIGSKIGAKS
jgi:glycerol-3-phosphate acyltransferase PlsY